ncbi:hypothetical protein [Streptomyces marianii]|uniref:Uncharacterized protein n=1 Tax=Streptomyces marianii TaxID=1817406 RepID=A0A5R9DRV6_9ACTN|nr:hypothetical protein [Streptomyces marianii]TLQ39229.1 hypothetical protein FEF34_38170 [Streptomyces marianii]
MEANVMTGQESTPTSRAEVMDAKSEARWKRVEGYRRQRGIDCGWDAQLKVSPYVGDSFALIESTDDLMPEEEFYLQHYATPKQRKRLRKNWNRALRGAYGSNPTG